MSVTSALSEHVEAVLKTNTRMRTASHGFWDGNGQGGGGGGCGGQHEGQDSKDLNQKLLLIDPYYVHSADSTSVKFFTIVTVC